MTHNEIKKLIEKSQKDFKGMKDSAKASRTIIWTLIGLTTAALFILKVCGFAAISWLTVLLPLITMVSFIGIMFIIVTILILIALS